MIIAAAGRACRRASKNRIAERVVFQLGEGQRRRLGLGMVFKA
jgi:hypothetical protein